MKKQLIAALLLSYVQITFAQDLEYLGNGRYSCTGSECGNFNALQNKIDHLDTGIDNGGGSILGNFNQEYDAQQRLENTIKKEEYDAKQQQVAAKKALEIQANEDEQKAHAQEVQDRYFKAWRNGYDAGVKDSLKKAHRK